MTLLVMTYVKTEEKRQKNKYEIEVTDNFEKIDTKDIQAVVISTPPDKHNEWIEWSIENRKPCFVEASVILDGLEEINKQAKKKEILVAPSCTMKFHPAIKDIKDIIRCGKYGKVTNFTYHSGQYLPDWHTYEDVKDFYVSKRETGGAREIVPFELTWICDIIGFPQEAIGFYGKTMDMGVDIDDTYLLSLKFKDRIYGNLTVDVVSRYAIRNLILNTENAQILWKWDERVVKLYDTINKRWIYFNYPEGITVEGYNRNITDDMYVEELKAFINAVNNSEKFPNSLDEDIRILKLLYKVEGKLK